MFVRRVVLYSVGTLTAAALIFLGFRKQEADGGTLLSIAQEHLKVAQMVPADTADAKLIKLREEQLECARTRLARVEEANPGMAITREMQAFSCVLEGDYKRASTWYEQALACDSLSEERRREIALNLARAKMEGGELPGALSALEEVEDAGRGTQWWLTRAHLAHRQNQLKLRGTALQNAFRAAMDDESARKIVAEAAFDLGDDIATSCYAAITDKAPMDWYRLAQLKVRAGQFDTASEALVRVRQSKPELFEKLMAADREFWGRYEGEGFHPMESQTNQAARPSK